jgi:hypothetical protein
MSLVADIPARRVSAHGAELARRDQRIAVAEMWLCMLEGLLDIGMGFFEFLAHRIALDKGGPKRPMMAFRFSGSPIAAFHRVQRGVRLAIALALKIQDEIAALRAGRLSNWDTLAPKATGPKATRTGVLADAVQEATGLGDADEAMDVEAPGDAVETPEGPEPLFSDLNELRGDKRAEAAFSKLLHGPVKDAVAAICADFGLKPDWSRWTKNGFPPPADGRKEDWVAFFVPEGDTGPAPPPEQPPPQTPPRACVRDPHHVLDPPRRELNDFLAAHGIKPLPPPLDQRSACMLPRFVLRQPRGGSGLPTSLYSEIQNRRP